MADYQWKKYHGVGIVFDEQVVRVKNDLALKYYLREDAGKGFFSGMRNEYRPARRMARFLMDAYRTGCFRRFGGSSNGSGTTWT